VTHHNHPPTPPRLAAGRFRALVAALRVERSAMRSTRGAAVIVVCVAAALALAAIVPSLASAGQTRLFAGTFGEATSSPADPYPLKDAGSVAVDSSTHDVYVADPRNFRVEKFDASGQFLFMLGLEVNKTAVEESATRNGEENVCPAAGHPTDVCQPGQPGRGPGAFIEPADLAVDNSPGSSKGDLYVANTGTAAVNDEQTVEIFAKEPGATFHLNYEDETTAQLALNASPASVEAALSLLAKLHGAVQVSGFPGEYTVKLSLKAASVPKMTCTAQGFVGCSVATTETVEKFDASGQPITNWGDAGELNAASVTDPPAPVAGPFRYIHGIAVDPHGNLWVSDGDFVPEEKVYEFNEAAGFVTGWTGTAGELAVDAEDTLYVNRMPFVWEYDSAGSEVGVVSPASDEADATGYVFRITGEAVDSSTGDLYVAGGEEAKLVRTGIVKRYDVSCHPVITHEDPEPGCEPVETFGVGLLQGGSEHRLAIDSSTQALYVADETRIVKFASLTVPDVLTAKPVNPTHTTALLAGTVNPSGVELNPGQEGCRFEWGETTAPYEHTAPCDKSAAQIGIGSEPVEVHAAITGLQAGRTYHYRLVASNANDANSSIQEPSIGADLTFGPPALENASILSVTATGAALQAQVDPNDLDTGVRIEYGTEAGVYSQSTAVLDVGSAGSSQAASFHVSGLTPGVTYHYRAVAENLLGEGSEAAVSPDQTYTTQATTVFLLPDGRAWELVSSPDTRGGSIKGLEEIGVIQAAAGGNAVTYIANGATEAMPEGNADAGVQILSVRSPGGWSSRDIAPPHSEAVGKAAGANPTDYSFFSSDMSLSIVVPQGVFNPEISPEASEEGPYLHRDFSAGESPVICSSGCYRPLVTAKQGYENVPPGTAFAGFGGPSGKCPSYAACGPQFLGATSDATHILLSSEAALVEGAPSGELYEWHGGRLELVSVRPGTGAPAPTTAEPRLGAESSARNAISADGSRVIWSEGQDLTSLHHLYLRDVATEETLQLDLNKGGTGKGLVEPTFQTASSDGSVVFFTDEQQLTPGSGAAPHAPDLYRCEIMTSEAGELECALTDLTPANGGEPASVQGENGTMLGADEDGATVYFFAKGVLTKAPNWRGEHAAPATCETTFGGGAESTATCNLYVIRGSKTTFIAPLSGTDQDNWADSNFSEQPARVSPNGQWLAFMSQRSLTGYDNRDVTTGKPVAEVYLYDAATNELRCASCDPDGARPHGVPYLQLQNGIDSGGGKGTWPTKALVSANLPAWTSMNGIGWTRYQDRYLSDQGRLFFNSVDGLVPQDSNGTLDVYEYEPPAVGSCTEAAATFSSRTEGCVGLISSGTASRESVFLDASESGNDVFFLTTAQLSHRDSDTAYSVYDARVGGGEAEPVAPVECQGDACQGFVEPPSDLTPGSLIFSGPGNLAPLAALPAKPSSRTVNCGKGARLVSGKCVKAKCAKGKKLSHGKCVKTPITHKKRARKKARKASYERRARS
jgi:hypothetical protein